MANIGTTFQKIIQLPTKWDQPDVTGEKVTGWGYLPLVSMFTAGGVFLFTLACLVGETYPNLAVLFFWLAMIFIFTPSAVRFSSRSISRNEGAGLVLLLGLSSFLVSYLRSPLRFLRFDEFLHWRTAYDILQTHHLFTPNPLLPVSPTYPGLENVTTALVSMTGLNINDAASLVLVCARLIMLLGLYLLYERISDSVRVAGIGTMVYMGSSTFLYFDAQFGYESLALPLAVLCAYMLYQRYWPDRRWNWIWSLLVAFTSFTLVLTHHVTTYMFVAFCLVWAVTDIISRIRGEAGNSPVGIGLWLLFATGVWVWAEAGTTISYLAPIFNDSLNSFANLILSNVGGRRLFEDAAGQQAIIADRIFGFSSVLVLLIGLALGAWQWLLRHNRRALPAALMLIAVSYPLLPLMRLSGGSWEMSNRLSGFVFVGLGFIVALGLVEFPLPRKLAAIRQPAVIIGLTLTFLGGVVAGASPDARLPQPYRPAASERSIDSEAMQAADWARMAFGPNQRMAGDRTLTNLMGSYGTQRMIVNLNDNVSISGIFLNNDLPVSERQTISDVSLQYLVVDKRIANATPTLGYYFESWEQTIVTYEPPVNLSVLEKFDFLPEVSRIYDSGNIAIYDVRGIAHAP